MSNPQQPHSPQPSTVTEDTNQTHRPPLQQAPTIPTVGAAFLLLLTLAANWRKIDSADLLFHLKVGQVIERTDYIPNRDIFSASASVEPWTYIEWLWASGLALAFQGAEWVGLSVVSVTLAALTALLTFIRSRKQGGRAFESLVIVTAMAIAMLPAWQPTPLVAVMPLFILALLIAESRKLWPLVLLPFVTMLWANLHPAFMLPLLAPLARLIMPQGRGGDTEYGAEFKPRLLLTVVIAGGLLCALISPHSTSIYPAATERLWAIASDFADNPAEQFKDAAYIWPLVAAFLFGAVAIAGGAVLSRWQWTVVAVIAIMALTVTPGALLFLLVFLAAPAAAGLSNLMKRLWMLNRIRYMAATALLLVCLMAIPAMLLTNGLVGRFWGSGISGDAFPQMPAGRLAAIPLRGSILNQPRTGGFLIWRLWPGWKVCADERLTFYSRTFCQQYEKVWQGASGWEAMFSLWRVYAVLGDNETARDLPDHNLYYELAESPDWVPVYWDSNNIMYVKSSINLASTNLVEFRQLKPGISWSALKARMQTRHQWAQLAADLRRALVDDPTNALAAEFLKLTEAEL